MTCKYLYYVLQHMMFCGKFENFIHFPTWSYDVICRLLDQNLALKEVIHALKWHLSAYRKMCVQVYYMKQYEWSLFSF